MLADNHYAISSVTLMVPADETCAVPSARPAILQRAEQFIFGLTKDEEEPLDRRAANAAVAFLRNTYFNFPRLPSPRIAQSPAGHVGVTWENATHHLNAQFFANEEVEIFVEDLTTREFESEDLRSVQMTTKLFAALSRFV